MCKETKALYFLFEIFNYKHYTFERHPKLGIIYSTFIYLHNYPDERYNYSIIQNY